jgi:hypothetical protein
MSDPLAKWGTKIHSSPFHGAVLPISDRSSAGEYQFVIIIPPCTATIVVGRERPHCIVGPDQYERLRAAALADPDAYWAGRGRERLQWRAPNDILIPAQMSELEKRMLKDGFAVMGTMREILAPRFSEA